MKRRVCRSGVIHWQYEDKSAALIANWQQVVVGDEANLRREWKSPGINAVPARHTSAQHYGFFSCAMPKVATRGLRLLHDILLHQDFCRCQDVVDKLRKGLEQQSGEASQRRRALAPYYCMVLPQGTASSCRSNPSRRDFSGRSSFRTKRFTRYSRRLQWPLAELGAPKAFYPVADGEDHLQVE